MTARSVRILAAAAGLTAAAPAALAAALINAAIVRKPPVSDETADDSDLVAATTAAAQREGRAWMAATPHQRWTVTAHDGTRLAGVLLSRTPAGSPHGHPHSRAPGRRIADGQLRARLPRARVQRRLYCFAVVEHPARRVRFLGVSANPDRCMGRPAGRNLMLDLGDHACDFRFLDP